MKQMEVLVIMTESQYKELDSEFRSKLKYVKFKEVDEYIENKEDSIYMQLYKASKKASKDKDEYLFKKRNK